MNKALENLIETGVNLMIAVGVLMLISTVWNLGRDAVITFEKQQIQQERAGELAEFSTLNGSKVTYARAVELITQYAGELDIYVDSTADGGAILITQKTGCKTVPASESWSSVTKNTAYAISNPSARIGGLNTDYYTNDSRMIAETQTLLNSDLTKKFGTGEWLVRIAYNNEKVGNCTGKKMEINDYVSGLRFQRVK